MGRLGDRYTEDGIREHHLAPSMPALSTVASTECPLERRHLHYGHLVGMSEKSTTWMGPENDTAEAVPIVGSRPAKYVELEGGLPALAITGNAENARRVSCPESLTEVHRRQEVLTSVEAAGIQGCTTSRHLSDR